jgi:hypothetical protein
MKTRTLLLLSVGVGLAILLAGGLFFVQLANQSTAIEPAEIGDPVAVGDVEVTVLATSEAEPIFAVDVEIGGVDDSDGIDSFELITGDLELSPITAPADGRCIEISEAPQRCRIEFDTSGADGSNRVLILQRGEQRRTWVLSGS